MINEISDRSYEMARCPVPPRYVCPFRRLFRCFLYHAPAASNFDPEKPRDWSAAIGIEPSREY